MAEKNFSTRIQDHMMNYLRRKHVPVTIFLKNGQILKGKVESFDSFTIKLAQTVNSRNNPNINQKTLTALVYKSCILTIIPAKKVMMKR
ncbi:MAG: RNA chaperone Hfq [Candidatus Muiribacterium halophilum]|uniref:RNA chaperone Hfq n=1 Tax=Muiribacterium halophilum TaxID=2053465 RepID=A0A2N5ZDF4_MUIH1|nr:MAG: RNA chaperone Hfq [Candidatus Muirbacterium halophilum]